MHYCPDCMSPCYCSGDIDDIQAFTEIWAYKNCQHRLLEPDECDGNPEAYMDIGDDYNPWDEEEEFIYDED